VCHPSNPAPGCLQIKFETTIEDLKKRECDAVFGTRAYKDMKKKLDKKDKECEQLKGSQSFLYIFFIFFLLPSCVRPVTPLKRPVTPLARCRFWQGGQEGPARRYLRSQGDK
jgi:hypothetical protein